jgi:hypothetical protein
MRASASVRFAFAADLPCWISIGIRMFSMVVFQGRSTACWNIMPISDRVPSTGLPASMTEPSDGDTKPAMILSRVDLPHPDAPITAVKLPRGRSKLVFSRAVTLWRAKVLRRLRTL